MKYLKTYEKFKDPYLIKEEELVKKINDLLTSHDLNFEGMELWFPNHERLNHLGTLYHGMLFEEGRWHLLSTGMFLYLDDLNIKQLYSLYAILSNLTKEYIEDSKVKNQSDKFNF